MWTVRSGNSKIECFSGLNHRLSTWISIRVFASALERWLQRSSVSQSAWALQHFQNYNLKHLSLILNFQSNPYLFKTNLTLPKPSQTYLWCFDWSIDNLEYSMESKLRVSHYLMPKWKEQNYQQTKYNA